MPDGPGRGTAGPGDDALPRRAVPPRDAADGSGAEGKAAAGKAANGGSTPAGDAAVSAARGADLTFQLAPETPAPAPRIGSLGLEVPGQDDPVEPGRPGSTRTRTPSRRVGTMPAVTPPGDAPTDEPVVDERTVAERLGQAGARTNDPLPPPHGWPREALDWPLRSGGLGVLGALAVALVLADLMTTSQLPALGFVGVVLKCLLFGLVVLRAWVRLVGSIAAGGDTLRAADAGWEVGPGAPSLAPAQAVLVFAPAGLALPLVVCFYLVPAPIGLLVGAVLSIWLAVALLGVALADRGLAWPHRALLWFVHRPLGFLVVASAWCVMLAHELAVLPALGRIEGDGRLVALVPSILLLRVATIWWLVVAARVLGVIGRCWTPVGYRAQPQPAEGTDAAAPSA
jgi:hypothetical protein